MGNIEFSNKLRKARIHAGLTQKDVYTILGVAQSTFSSWEIGKSEPDANTLIRLCQIYGIDSLSYFMDSPVFSETLAPTEQHHIQKYRQLSAQGQKTVDTLMDNLLDAAAPPSSSTQPPIYHGKAAAFGGAHIESDIPEENLVQSIQAMREYKEFQKNGKE